MKQPLHAWVSAVCGALPMPPTHAPALFWSATLASLLSEGPSLSKPLPLLTSLVFNALSSGATTQPPLPPSDDDRLPPHLSLVALALR
jgi:hypothetical protein